MAERHPKRQALPLHPTPECTVRTTDDPVATEKQSRSNGICERGHVSGPAFETRERILFNGQWMQSRAEAVRLLFPLIHRRELTRKMWLPKRDVADTTDTEDRRELRAV